MTKIRDEVMAQPEGERLEYALGLLEMAFPDFDDHRVVYLQRTYRLTPQQAKILSVIDNAAGRTARYDHIVQSVWNGTDNGDNDLLKVHLCKIRAQLKRMNGPVIETVRGVGLRLREPIEYPEPSEIKVKPVHTIFVPAVNQGLEWTDVDLAQMKRLALSGNTWPYIAFEMDRTRRGCRDQWARMCRNDPTLKTRRADAIAGRDVRSTGVAGTPS